jgi:hypothetical protein
MEKCQRSRFRAWERAAQARLGAEHRRLKHSTNVRFAAVGHAGHGSDGEAVSPAKCEHQALSRGGLGANTPAKVDGELVEVRPKREVHMRSVREVVPTKAS